MASRSYSDSLEHMLAELEAPANDHHRNNTLDDIGNIDDFLDKIEEEARMSHNRQNTDYQVEEYYEPPPSAKTHTPQKHHATPAQQPQRKPSEPVIPQHTASPPAKQQQQQQHHHNPPQQQHSQPRPVSYQAPSGGTSSHHEAIQDLESQGYERHHNKGKWINYSGGKATDFRIKGTTSTRVGLSHVITLRALDDYGNPAKVDNPKEFIGCILTHTQTNSDLPCWYRDNGNCEYDLAFCPDQAGSVRMEIKLVGNPMFDIEIQVEDVGSSVWVAKPRLPAKPKELFIVDIETQDGSRPEGVAPFQVQTVGSVENLRLINNGDGTYRFQCVPQCAGHITIQLTLHGQPIKNSPITVQVGERQQIKIKQESSHVETISDTRPQHQKQQESYDYDPYEGGNHEDEPNNNYQPRESHSNADVSNDDLNRLLDELGG
jgi:hypothetical protein